MRAESQDHRSYFANAFLFLLLLCVCSVNVAGAAEPPPWSANTRGGLFQVTLEPQEGAVRINAMQRWVVTVKDSKGADISSARVLLDGGMRAHGHGLPTKPQVTQYLGNGQYLIEGLRLNMVGEWTLMIGIELNGQRDLVTFDIEIDY